MYNGGYARVQQELLIGRNTGVCDGPAQVARLHILPQSPVVVHIIQSHSALVLESSCTVQAAGQSTHTQDKIDSII